MRNPLQATGWVVEQIGTRLQYRGTCFGYRHTGVLLTAAHCVARADPRNLTIGIYQQPIDPALPVQSDGGPRQPGLPVIHVEPHPSADLAVIRIGDHVGYFDRFVDLEKTWDLGDPVSSFGYPVDAIEPTPRFFRGHVQRQFYHDRAPYQYHAAELSFGAPAGLSGGPVAMARTSDRVVGLITENHRSSTFVETIEGVSVDEPTREVHAVLHYATCVLLGPLEDWLARNAVPADGRLPRDA